MAEKASMLWIDLESTGLVARKDVPLELGLRLTDRWGEKIAERSWLIWEENEDFQSGVRRGRDNEYVNNMHIKSGLWEALDDDEFPPMSRKQVDDAACDWLTEQNIRFGTLPMCGNSIGSLDRPFVQEHLPQLNEAFHYRNVDMSSLKEICRQVNPELFEKLKPIIDDKSAAEHRVFGDIEASVQEYKAYIDNFLYVTEAQ